MIERRYIAPPGPPSSKGSYLPEYLATTRLALSPNEAAAIDDRLAVWLQRNGHWNDFDARWSEQVMLFEKVGSGTGDKVVIHGYDRSVFESPGSGSVTIDMLRLMSLSNDFGCSVWSALYDVKRKTFERFGCNGQG